GAGPSRRGETRGLLAQAPRRFGRFAAPAPRQTSRVNDPAMDEPGQGHTNSETSISVRGPSIAVGFNDASQNGSGYSFSTDGGASFTHRRLTPPTGGFTFGDPVVAHGPNGEIYYGTLMVIENG